MVVQVDCNAWLESPDTASVGGKVVAKSVVAESVALIESDSGMVDAPVESDGGDVDAPVDTLDCDANADGDAECDETGVVVYDGDDDEQPSSQCVKPTAHCKLMAYRAN